MPFNGKSVTRDAQRLRYTRNFRTEKRSRTKDDWRIGGIDIEFFVVKKGIPQRIEQIIKLFVKSMVFDDGIFGFADRPPCPSIPGRFPVVRAKLPPLAFPSSFYPIHPWN